MSKLYSALEKIRVHEDAILSPAIEKRTRRKELSPGRKASPLAKLTLPGGALLLIIAMLVSFPAIQNNTHWLSDIFSQQKARVLKTSIKPPSNLPVGPAASSRPASQAVTGNTAETYRQLNETGCNLVDEGRHWRAVYFFDRANKLDPKRPEALINMGVALAELGLNVPARRLFREAAAIAPDHPQLLNNLEILGHEE